MSTRQIQTLASDLDIRLTAATEEARHFEFLAVLRNRALSCRPMGEAWEVVSRSGKVWARA